MKSQTFLTKKWLPGSSAANLGIPAANLGISAASFWSFLDITSPKTSLISWSVPFCSFFELMDFMKSPRTNSSWISWSLPSGTLQGFYEVPPPKKTETSWNSWTPSKSYNGFQKQILHVFYEVSQKRLMNNSWVSWSLPKQTAHGIYEVCENRSWSL